MSHRRDLFEALHRDGVAVVRLSEAVDSLNFAAAVEALCAYVTDERPDWLLVDFDNLHYLQTSGLKKLETLQQTAARTGAELTICSLRPQLTQALQRASLAAPLEAAENEEAALQRRRNGHDVPARRHERPRPTDGARRGSSDPAETPDRRSPDTRRESSGVMLWLSGFFSVHLRLIAIISLAAAAVGLVVFPNWAPGRAAHIRGVCTEVYSQYRHLKSADSTAGQWTEFEETARSRLAPAIGELSRRGSGRSDAEEQLLKAMRSLMDLIEAHGAEAPEEEQRFRTSLQNTEAE